MKKYHSMQRNRCKKRMIFAQDLFFRMVISLLDCYFLIKYLYSFDEQKLHKKMTHISDVYLKTVVFPLK